MTVARDEICNLLYRYTEAIDAGDFEGLSVLFATAVLLNADGSLRSDTPDHMLARWRGRIMLYDGVPRTRHLTMNPIIHIDEQAGTAQARSAYIVFQVTDSFPLQAVIFGRYHDRFARSGHGQWAFASRQFFVDGQGDLSHHLNYPAC